MLERLVSIASSRRTKVCLLILWLLSLAYMFLAGWNKITYYRKHGGGVLRTETVLELHSTPLFVWLTLIIGAYFAHGFKRRSPGYFGLAEVGVGFVAGVVAAAKLPESSGWVALGTSAFLIVRGASNISEAVRHEKTRPNDRNV